MHKTIEPSILYFGTPVILISTRNEDGTTNVAPMSSAWFLGWSCMAGLAADSKTTQNLNRERECVLNFPSVAEVDAVNRLAKTTGANPIPEWRTINGYQHVKNKLGHADLTAQPSERVQPPRIAECPVQMEAVLQAAHPFGGFAPQRSYGEDLPNAFIHAYELKIIRVHVAEELLREGKPNHVDSDKWKPLIMSFSKFYGLADGQILTSRLAEIPEEQYRPAERMGEARSDEDVMIPA